MKKYMDTTTGETYTEEELREAYSDVATDLWERGIETFEQYFEEAIEKGNIVEQ